MNFLIALLIIAGPQCYTNAAGTWCKQGDAYMLTQPSQAELDRRAAQVAAEAADEAQRELERLATRKIMCALADWAEAQGKITANQATKVREVFCDQ